MGCTSWNERLTERLYGEISAEAGAALDVHLATCASCRSRLDDFQRVRTVLRADEPFAPVAPRVVVLRDRSRLRPLLLAASVAGAAMLAGAGAGLGYAMGRTQAPPAAIVATSQPETANGATDEAVRREVDRRFAAWEASRNNPAAPNGPATTLAATGDPLVSASALRAEFAKFERRLNGARASDLDYMLGQIAASEYRVGSRLGKTNDALRTVALASNPYVNEQ
jgi:hypothetical protein